MADRPRFHAMSNDELEAYIRANNNDFFDLGEVFSGAPEIDEEEALRAAQEEAEKEYREELESVAEDIFFNNNPSN